MDIPAAYEEYTKAYEAGGYAAAEPIARQILAQTGKWWRRGDGTSQVLSAQMRYTIARASFDRGEFEAASDEVRRGREAVARARTVKDPRYAFEGLMLLLTRGEIEMAQTRLEDALGTFFAAAQFENESDHPLWFEAQTNLLLAKQWALQSLGRFDESEKAAGEALALASQHEPRLVPTALERIAMVRRLTGGSGDDHLAAAEAILSSQDARPVDRAGLAYSQASVALQRGDLEAAERYLSEAEQAYLALGDVRSAVSAIVGYAEIARQRRRTDEAIAAARRAVARAADVGDAGTSVEACTILGLALEDAGRGADALGALDDARAAAADDRMQLIRVDVHRAVIAYNIGVHLSNAQPAGSAFGTAAAQAPRRAEPQDGSAPRTREEAFALAASISVPAAFASDAVRHELAPGENRERWTREVSMRLADQALQALTALGRADEIVDLLEHVAASASAGIGGAPDAVFETASAGGPPPRIRSFPDRDGPVWWAIDAAEERYGLRARGAETVTAW
jgi:tetratricopeptide (TPR) repeat protein